MDILKNNEYSLLHLNPDNYGLDSDSSIRKKDLRRLNSFKKKLTQDRGIPNNLEQLAQNRRRKKEREEKKKAAMLQLENSVNDNREKSPTFLLLEKEYKEKKNKDKSTELKERKFKLYNFKNNYTGNTDAKVGLDMLHTDELMGYYKEIVDKGKRDFIQHHRKQNIVKKVEYG